VIISIEKQIRFLSFEQLYNKWICLMANFFICFKEIFAIFDFFALFAF